MTDTVILTCPGCGGHKIIDNQALYAKIMRVDKPGDVQREVKLTMYTCLTCARNFNEMEGRGE
jgi:DNA-directed RNA polymerase subunit RPC12/RpoP